MSVLADGASMAYGESRQGSPAALAKVGVPVLDEPGGSKRRRTFLFGAIHFGLIYAMGYFLILSAAPAVAMVAVALAKGGPLWGMAAAFAVVPVSVVWYVLLLVAVKRLCIGHIELGRNRVGERTFVGSSALLPGGSDIGDNALLGVLSAPATGQQLPSNERRLGAPAFALPQTQKDLCFSDAQTYRPSRATLRSRAISDAVRVLLPGMIATASLVALVGSLVLASRALPLWG
jgi:hypothetical protein